MTFRITIDEEAGTRVVRLAGWLEGEVVTELERVLLDTSAALRLDLTELRSADAAGVSCLRALRTKGVSFAGASPFVRLLLGIEASRPPPTGGPRGDRLDGIANATHQLEQERCNDPHIASSGSDI